MAENLTIQRLSLFAFAIALLTIGLRLPSIVHPLAIDDEETYSVVANEVVDGGKVYTDAVERKPPLLFWTYAAIFQVFGKYNWRALHLVALLWTFATMAGLFVAGKRLFDPLTGLVAALLYSIFQPWLTYLNLAFNGEVVMNLPLVWAWAIAFGRSRSTARSELFVAGGLLAAGFLLKQPAAIAAIPVGVYLLLPSYRKTRGVTFANSILQATVLTSGFVAVLAVTAIELKREGTLSEAFYWIFTNHSIHHVFWLKGALFTLGFALSCLPLLLAAGTAFYDRAGIWTKRKPERTALIGLLVASAIGAAAGARFYPHYYIQLIPPLALLAAPWLATVWAGTTRPFHWWQNRTVTSLWLGLTIIVFSISYWTLLSHQREPSEAGRYLREHSLPNDRIFVWGQMPRIYLDAERRPASRFVVTFPLTGYIFGLTGVDTTNNIVPGAWMKLEQDFRNHQPAYIVDVQLGAKNSQYPIANYPFLASLIAQRYQPVARTTEGVIYQFVR